MLRIERVGLSERFGLVKRIGLGETEQAVQIGAGDGEAASSKGLIAVVFADGGDGELDLVVAELTLERA